MPGSTSASVRSWQAPRKVFIVRWPSGVTSTKQRAVAGPSGAWGIGKSTPARRMSSVKRSPRWSSLTLPTKAARQPKLAAPITVLAAEPPETTVVSPMASRSSSAGASSISAIVPFVNACSVRNASDVCAMMSTMALPRPRMS